MSHGGWGRVRSLDGLRGVAALVVVLHHVVLTDPRLAAPYQVPGEQVPWGGAGGWPLYTPLHLLWDGPQAVMVFFVLSGYVLALPSVDGAHPVDWLAYYPRRLVRLYLPTVAAVGLALLLIALVPRTPVEGASWWIARHVGVPSAGRVLQDLTLAGHPGATNVPLWSLKWEVLFSLLLPVFVVGVPLVLRAGRRAAPLLAGGLVVVMLVGGSSGHSSLLFLPMFGVGVLMAFSREALGRLAARISAGPWPAMVWTLLAVTALEVSELSWALVVRSHGVGSGREVAAGHLVEVGGAAALVFLCGHWPGARTVLERPVVAWLGARSFSLYLVHEPVAVTITYVLGGRPPLELVLTVAVPTVLVVTEGFYRVVERPSLALARRAGRVGRVGRAPEVAAPASAQLPVAARPR